MIKKIILENFKGFSKRTEIPLGKLTLIYGKNSAGKSSIIQSLQLLNQSMDQSASNNEPTDPSLIFRRENGVVDLGNYSECINNHETSKNLTMGCVVSQTPSGPNKKDKEETDVLLEYTYGCNKTKGVHFKNLYFKNLSEKRILDGATFVYDKSFNCIAWKVDRYSKKMIRSLYNIINENLKDFKKLISQHLDVDKLLDERFGKSRKSRTGDDDLDSEFKEYINGNLVPGNNYYKLIAKVIKQHRMKFKEMVKFYRKDGIIFNDFEKRLKKITARDIRERPIIPGLFHGSRFNRRHHIKLLEEYSGLHEYIELVPELYLCDQVKNAPNWLKEIRKITWNTTINEVQDAGFYMLSHLNNFKCMLANRADPKRFYVNSNIQKKGVGIEGENLPEVLFNDRNLCNKVNHWIQALDIPYKIKPVTFGSNNDLFEIRLVDLKSKGKRKEVCWTDAGFGISQIIPIVAQLITPSGMLAIQQPESQIHPKLQSDFTSLLAWSIKKRRDQVIVETHSEHIILHIQKLIKGKLISSREVKVLYVDRNADGSFVKDLRLDDNGKFMDRWPGGFFPERMELIS